MARRVATAVPCGLVQVIRLQWDKSARGGQGARDRNAVPLAFEVPAKRLLDAGGQLHVEELHWGHRNNFAEPFTARHRRIPVAEGFRFGCVAVSEHLAGLLVRYRWGEWEAGAPARSFINAMGYTEPVTRDLVVHAAEWVRVCTNGRFSDIDTGDWWYEQLTVNVAWFEDAPSGRVFVSGEPTQEIRMIADLW